MEIRIKAKPADLLIINSH